MSKPSTVLIVDDEIGPRESLRAILKPEHQVFIATEGEQAIKMVEETPIDVVLLDLRMPGMSGIRVLERIKAINPDIEVLLITGYASYETVLEALRLHAFDYIPKPFNIPELRHKVRLAVTQRQSYTRTAEGAKEHGRCEEVNALPSMTLPTGSWASEKSSAVFRGNVQEPLHAIEESSQILLSQYAQHLDACGRETLQRMHEAVQTLTKGLNEALSPGVRWATPPWSTSSVSVSSSNACS
jgi:DNA-binding response OmpR family regulator